jgi:hypothetical protein
MNWDAFNQGWASWERFILHGEKDTNPYEKHSVNWISWNKGWNLNLNGI